MASLRTSIPVLTLLLLLFTFSEAKVFQVGGNENSWNTTTSSESLNHWAENERFEVGDFLIFEYNPKIDSLLEVSKEDYESCKVTNAIKEYKDGKTKVELDKSGPFYFISKAKGSCEKGQKLTVVVLSNKHHHKHSPSPASAPGAQAPGAQAPGPALPPYTPPNGAIGLRGGFIGIVVGIIEKE
uniref:Phytocyanin domain-containing protein n=1 Tax=Fagus sylvatica TaxID=28930 RepID=A0A2N9FWV3_FAGSY